MKTQELIDALRKHSHNFVTTKKYCVQVYSGGKRGNIKRLDETVVCVFDIEEGRIMIAPAKDNFPYSFGYTRYEIKANEDLETIARIDHKDSKEIFDAFSDILNND